LIATGSVSGAAVYWLFLTFFGIALAAGALLELRRRGKPIQRWHLVAAGAAIAGSAAFAYAGVWRSFYLLEPTDAGVVLTYRWPSRQVLVPWDSVAAVNTAPGYKGTRPVRLVLTSGGEHRSAMVPVREALRISRCVGAEVDRRQGRQANGLAAEGCRPRGD
jgi:hypothetical protein